MLIWLLRPYIDAAIDAIATIIDAAIAIAAIIDAAIAIAAIIDAAIAIAAIIAASNRRAWGAAPSASGCAAPCRFSRYNRLREH